MKIINKKSLLSLSLLTTFMFLASVSFVFAAGTDWKPGTVPPGAVDIEVKAVLENAIKWIMGIVSLISALVIIIAGIMWATAGGDEDRQGKARKMLIAGVVGLIIALGAWALVKAVGALF